MQLFLQYIMDNTLLLLGLSIVFLVTFGIYYSFIDSIKYNNNINVIIEYMLASLLVVLFVCMLLSFLILKLSIILNVIKFVIHMC